MTIPQVERALRDMGGTHEMPDIIAAIRDNKMRGFINGESWIVVQILQFPRKKVLEVFLCVGRLEQLQALHDQVLAYGREQGCNLIRAIGRSGWEPFADGEGWHKGASVYWKEI